MSSLDVSDGFARRHIGPSPDERDAMLQAVGAPTLDALMGEAIPASIRLKTPLSLPPAESEQQYLNRLGHLAHRNQVFRSYIGLGYYDTFTPSVIQRMVLENPGWYTPYTPYQAEIAQGRLESLLNFQTMVMDLTAMEVASASLLDEATAAGEAMALMHRARPGNRSDAAHSVCLVADGCFPQTIDVVRSRAEPLGVELRVVPLNQMTFERPVFGAIVQYPDAGGAVTDLKPFIERAHQAGALVSVGADLLSLALLVPPGLMGADVVYGSAQRFGVPLGYGGPHAAFFATRNSFVRQLPGRLIGVSVDTHGHRAYRMALATREQHIRREKATSNICTAQALLANMAAMYAVFHGPDGIKAIASRVHTLARVLEAELVALGYSQLNAHYFDTLRVRVAGGVESLLRRAHAAAMNFHLIDGETVSIALNETVSTSDIRDIVDVFAASSGQPAHTIDCDATAATLRAAAPDAFPPALRRSSPFLTHPVFNTHRSESEMMRYIRGLERKDIGLDTSMIPLGSCTMKLNAASEMLPITWAAFGRLHPFAPVEQAEGYAQVFRELEAALCEITGFAEVSLQPNSGAQGEFTGLMVIRA
ncbi:MAG TPA: hypothetical protein VFS23_35445, partial [Vicinamibacterales bacterium]|nr:hypothetical protein [Vicinamibacterales bacterium]